MFLFFFIYFKESLALFLIYVILGSALIVATFTDLQLKIIPDEITIGGTLAAFLLSIIYPAIHNTDLWFLAAGRSLLGMLVGGLSIYLAGVLGKIMFKKESMGAGDIKLLIMIGAFLGWKLTLLTFFIAPFFGAVVGIIVKIKTKQDIIPYGPFLSLACFVVILYGQQILDLLMPY
jgi:leader peptidase (prepilin peptidase)/N-methyltransferase